MTTSKQEALKKLQVAHKYGDMSATQLANLTPAEREEFQNELLAYMQGGQSDSERDLAQTARLQRLQAAAEGA